MKGTVFQTSARMMIQIEGHSLGQRRGVAGEPADVLGPGEPPGERRDDGDDRVGHQRRRADEARPTIVRCITMASTMPSTSSRAAPTTVMNIVTPNACHQIGLRQHGDVVARGR